MLLTLLDKKNKEKKISTFLSSRRIPYCFANLCLPKFWLPSLKTRPLNEIGTLSNVQKILHVFQSLLGRGEVFVYAAVIVYNCVGA